MQYKHIFNIISIFLLFTFEKNYNYSCPNTISTLLHRGKMRYMSNNLNSY